MFEDHKARKAVKQYQKQLSQWQALYDAGTDMLQLAKGYRGEGWPEFMCKPSEVVFAKMTTTDLVEYRSGPRTYEGRSRGVSFPIFPGIRYRTGQTRGRSVQGEPQRTVIDTGTVYVTNSRLVFKGRKQTRECSFDKIVGLEREEKTGTMVVSVSNRQTPMTLYYGPKIAPWFGFRMELAMAHHRGTVQDLIRQLESSMAQVERTKPVPLDS